ncbi:MAG: N-acetylmuramoyl-L-alanine amidase [Alphaproteobacteria bacterium]|nr:MAG: N-acetylmuramoyl-L-alanine amidase [Alphaproteobacteria bacterium]
MRMISAPSPNFDERAAGKSVDMVVLHYTGMESMAAALARMLDVNAKVSAHYMIDKDGSLYRLVDETHRAWHAGVSYWAGERDINSISIGIELVNPGHAYPGYAGGYRPFPEAQMATLEALLGEVMARHRILPSRVLGHSDVAPARKKDPGELFDWERLAAAGLAEMPQAADPAPGPDLAPGATGEAVSRLQAALARFGYDIAETGRYDEPTTLVVAAFQRHYRRARVDGIADGETRGRLIALLDRGGR